MEKALLLLNSIIEKESVDDAVLKQNDKTVVGESWTLHHLKLLKELLEEKEQK